MDTYYYLNKTIEYENMGRYPNWLKGADCKSVT